jgi:hypothetical protein
VTGDDTIDFIFPSSERRKPFFLGKRLFLRAKVEGNELEVGQYEHFPARSGSRPTPGPGSSRGRSAMALETPPHVGRRPGSLRASVGASSSGVKSASSEVSAAESMRAVAARLEKHTAALRSAMDQTSRLDDGSASGASAKGAVAVAAARALDAASSSSDDDAFDAAAHETRLRSYRTADVHIKKAAAKIAGHKKWYADRANSHKKATESCASALEELSSPRWCFSGDTTRTPCPPPPPRGRDPAARRRRQKTTTTFRMLRASWWTRWWRPRESCV